MNCLKVCCTLNRLCSALLVISLGKVRLKWWLSKNCGIGIGSHRKETTNSEPLKKPWKLSRARVCSALLMINPRDVEVGKMVVNGSDERGGRDREPPEPGERRT